MLGGSMVAHLQHIQISLTTISSVWNLNPGIQYFEWAIASSLPFVFPDPNNLILTEHNRQEFLSLQGSLQLFSCNIFNLKTRRLRIFPSLSPRVWPQLRGHLLVAMTGWVHWQHRRVVMRSCWVWLYFLTWHSHLDITDGGESHAAPVLAVLTQDARRLIREWLHQGLWLVSFLQCCILIGHVLTSALFLTTFLLDTFHESFTWVLVHLVCNYILYISILQWLVFFLKLPNAKEILILTISIWSHLLLIANWDHCWLTYLAAISLRSAWPGPGSARVTSSWPGSRVTQEAA